MSRIARIHVLGVLTVFTILLASSATAAVDVFLQIDGITGESVDAQHKGWMDVLAFSNNVSSAQVTQRPRGGQGAGKPSFSDFQITKYIDAGTPFLLRSAAEGKHYPTATVEVYKAGGEKRQLYLRYKLKDVIVTSVSQGGSGGEDRFAESISLNFSNIEWTYVLQDEKGQSQNVTTGWDLATNKGY